jgi:PAS domain S-box-containing protein
MDRTEDCIDRTKSTGKSDQSVNEERKSLKLVNAAESNLNRDEAVLALRESEELHRITLLSISDAVFITDDYGEFTFICPNAHVIFGYERDEVAGMRGITALLGDDLYDPRKLDQAGEIQNIERQITDRYGRKHVVLINVKRVAIKGGTVLISCRDITERKQAELELQKAHEELEQRVRERTSDLEEAKEDLKVTNSRLETEQRALREKNIALKEVLGQIDEEKTRLTRQIKSNVDRIIMPILHKLHERLDDTNAEYVSLLENSLVDIVSPFTHGLESSYGCLTSREIQVCNMVRQGLSTKDIAAHFNISDKTVAKQRRIIRRKLGISGRKVNLATHLKSL